jgi:antitoxin (DNA-binding transcriptional repressor) of toxin-antitoxin stability system
MDGHVTIEADASLEPLLAPLATGRDVVITRGGVPVARVTGADLGQSDAPGAASADHAPIRSTTVFSPEEIARMREAANGPPGPIALALMEIRERGKSGPDSWKDLRDAGRKW